VTVPGETPEDLTYDDDHPQRAGRLAPPLFEEWGDDARFHLSLFEGRLARSEHKADRIWPQERRDIRDEEDRRFRQRSEGFVVWLATNPRYHYELEGLQSRYGDVIEEQGGFPRRRPIRRVARGELRPPDGFLSAASPSLSRTFSEEVRIAFEEFYHRWSLDTLLTWDVPLPHMFEASLEWSPGDGEGLQVCIPWHLLRSGMVDFDTIFKRYRRERCPRQLRAWFEAKDEAAEEFGGELATSRQFQLYLSLHLVLADRYADAVERHRIEDLQGAFAPTMGNRVGLETVRKLHQKLDGDLQAARSLDADITLPPVNEWIMVAPDLGPLSPEVDGEDLGEERPPTSPRL
jgi:hypothetical protein